jgi:hypothetical protein
MLAQDDEELPFEANVHACRHGYAALTIAAGGLRTAESAL